MAQVAGLGEIGADPRRAFFVEVQVSDDGAAAFIQAFVAAVPPGTHAAAPPMISLEYFDDSGNLTMSRNAWDPRIEHEESLDGMESRVDLSVATGSFDIVFRSDVARVRVTDLQVMTKMALMMKLTIVL